MALVRWLIQDRLIPQLRKDYVDLIDSNGVKSGIANTLASTFLPEKWQEDKKLTSQKKESAELFITTLNEILNGTEKKTDKEQPNQEQPKLEQSQKEQSKQGQLPGKDKVPQSETQKLLDVIWEAIRLERIKVAEIELQHQGKEGTYDGLLTVISLALHEVPKFESYLDILQVNKNNGKNKCRNDLALGLVKKYLEVLVSQFVSETSKSRLDAMFVKNVGGGQEFRKQFFIFLKETLDDLKKIDFKEVEAHPKLYFTYLKLLAQNSLYKIAELEQNYKVKLDGLRFWLESQVKSLKEEDAQSKDNPEVDSSQNKSELKDQTGAEDGDDLGKQENNDETPPLLLSSTAQQVGNAKATLQTATENVAESNAAESEAEAETAVDDQAKTATTTKNDSL